MIDSYTIDQRLKNKIIDHEGLKTTLYKDSLGNLTIGVGHLLEPSKGGKISINASMFILGEDLAGAHSQLIKYSWFNQLDDIRQGMLIEMCFNIGMHGVLEFTDMIKSIVKQDYYQASLDFLNSREAHQIKSERADDMAYRLRFGQYK